MPLYCFVCSRCETKVQRMFGMEEVERRRRVRCPRCRSRCERDYPAEKGDFHNTSGNWPRTSTAAGVAPHQAKAAYEQSVAMGVPTEFDHDGDPVFTGPAHQKKYLEKIGLFDRDAGYRDATPTGTKEQEDVGHDGAEEYI